MNKRRKPDMLTDAIRKTYSNMECSDRDCIARLAAQMMKNHRLYYGAPTNLGLDAYIELIGKLSVFFVTRDIK